MKRRQFLKQTASVAGISFVGCGLGGSINASAQSGDGRRRQVMVNGKRMLTVDIHCHSYVHDVWPLISERDDIAYLDSVVNVEPLRNKLDINNVDFRLAQMDEQGIDMSRQLSLHVGQYHHWADLDLASRNCHYSKREDRGNLRESPGTLRRSWRGRFAASGTCRTANETCCVGISICAAS